MVDIWREWYGRAVVIQTQIFYNELRVIRKERGNAHIGTVSFTSRVNIAFWNTDFCFFSWSEAKQNEHDVSAFGLCGRGNSKYDMQSISWRNHDQSDISTDRASTANPFLLPLLWLLVACILCVSIHCVSLLSNQ